MTSSRISNITSSCRAWLLVLVVLATVLMPRPVCAESPDDEYLRIYDLMVQADALKDAGKTDLARTKYLEVQRELVKFKNANPTWNPKVVTYRLSELAAKLASAPAKAGPGDTSAPAGSGATAEAPKAKVLEAGAEPRIALRFHPKAGDKQTLALKLEKSMTMEADGGPARSMQIPTTELIINFEVTAVSAQGDITYAVEVVDFRLDIDSGDSAAAEEASAVMKGFKGIKGMCVVSDRGEPRSSEFKLPPEADPQLRQALDQIKEFASPMKLLEPAVGVGGKWEVAQTVRTQGINVPQTERYEVVSISGDEVVIKTGIEQQTSGQKIQNPQMPGMKTDVTKMEAKGEGLTTLSLARLMPLSEQMVLRTDMDMTMTMRDKKQSMSIKSEMKSKAETK